VAGTGFRPSPVGRLRIRGLPLDQIRSGLDAARATAQKAGTAPACRIISHCGSLAGAVMTKRSRKETILGLPPTNSAATPPGPWTVVLPPGKPRRRKGPQPGTVDRYGKSDRALYGDMRRLMGDGRMSATGAARHLAEKGKIEGGGAPESLARRLARRYRAETQ
jgi:hypothetical protein